MNSRPLYYYIRGDFKAKFHGTLDDLKGLRGTAFYEIEFFDAELSNPKKDMQFAKLDYKVLEPNEDERIIQKQLKDVIIHMDGKYYKESFEDVLLQDIKIHKTAKEGKETYGVLTCKLTAIAYTSTLFYADRRGLDPWQENMFREPVLEEFIFEPTPIVVDIPETTAIPSPPEKEPSIWSFIIFTFSLLFLLWLMSLILSWFDSLNQESIVSVLIIAGVFTMAILIQWLLPKLRARFSNQPQNYDGWFFARFLLLLAAGGLTYYLLYSGLYQLASMTAFVSLFVLGSFIFRGAHWLYNRFSYTVVVLYLILLFVGMGFRDRIFPEAGTSTLTTKGKLTYQSMMPFQFLTDIGKSLPFSDFLIEQAFVDARSNRLYHNNHKTYFNFQNSYWSQLYQMKEANNFTEEAFAYFIVQSCRKVSKSEEFWANSGLSGTPEDNKQAQAAWLYLSLAHFDYDVILLKHKTADDYLIGLNYYIEEGDAFIIHQGSKYFLIDPIRPGLFIGKLHREFLLEDYLVLRANR